MEYQDWEKNSARISGSAHDSIADCYAVLAILQVMSNAGIHTKGKDGQIISTSCLLKLWRKDHRRQHAATYLRRIF